MDRYATVWTEDFSLLTTSVSNWCPAGWQAHKDKLLSTEGIRQSLLTNAHYPKIGPAVAAIQSMAKAAKMVPPMISANVVKNANDAATLGVETVAITFALFQATTVLQKQPNAKVRLQQISGMESELAAKKVALGGELLTFIEKLKDPEYKPASD